MRRASIDRPRTLRVWLEHHKYHERLNATHPGGLNVTCPCDRQPGRFRKKKPLDCGNTKCGICHRDKFPKRQKTRQELRAEED